MAEETEKLEVMDQGAINEYLDALLQGKQEVEGLEARTLNMFKTARARLNQVETEINKITKRLEELRTAALQFRGEAAGYASMLAFAEDERRARNVTKPKKQKPVRAQVPGKE